MPNSYYDNEWDNEDDEDEQLYGQFPHGLADEDLEYDDDEELSDDEDWENDLRREAEARAQIKQIREFSLVNRIKRAIEEARKRLSGAWGKEQRREILKRIIEEFFDFD